MAMMKSIAYPERGGVALRYPGSIGFRFGVDPPVGFAGPVGGGDVAWHVLPPGRDGPRIAGGEPLIQSRSEDGALGIVLNLLVVFVWVFTRVVSVPELFAPVRLPVDGLGAVATVVEVALLILLVMVMQQLPPKGRND